MKTHPSVDDLYDELKKKHPSISKATVYRNMRSFVEKGIALQVAVTGDASRFDGCTDFHFHFICNDCRKVIDLQIDGADDSEKLNNIVQNQYGFKVDKQLTSFFGTCLDCCATV